jgi:hypothetical protein
MSEFVGNVVWIDRREAKVFHVGSHEEQKLVIESRASIGHVQPDYFAKVVSAITDVGGILLTGPGNAKFELKVFLDTHHPEMAANIYGVESLDDPRDDVLLALARRFFSVRGHRRMHETEASARNPNA